MLKRTLRKNTCEVTFIVPGDYRCGQVSVVGDFNAWQPGAHPLAERKDGSRAVTVKLPTRQQYQFRYLAEGGHWFNEEHADAYLGSNSVLLT